MSDLQAWLGVLVALTVIAGFIGSWWMKAGRDQWRKVVQFFTRLGQTISGVPAEIDAYGHERTPAIPPLAEQMAGIHQTVANLGQKVDDLSKRDERISALELTVANIDKRVTAIEGGHQLERITGNVAQAKMVDAIAEANRRRDVVDVDEPDTEL